MTLDRKRLKKDARTALKGHIGGAAAVVSLYILTALGVSYLFMLLSYVVNQGVLAYIYVYTGISLDKPLVLLGIEIAGYFALFLLSPLSYGAYRWFYRLIGGQPVKIRDVFFFFHAKKTYFEALRLHALLWLRYFGVMLAFLVSPVALVGGLLYMMMPVGSSWDDYVDASLTPLLGAGAVIGILLLLVMALLFAVRYMLAVYLMFEGESKANKTIKDSRRYMKERSNEALELYGSFVGWTVLYVVAVAVVAVGLSFTVLDAYAKNAILVSAALILWLPVWIYLQSSVAVYSKFIIENNRRYAGDQNTIQFRMGPEIPVFAYGSGQTAPADSGAALEASEQKRRTNRPEIPTRIPENWNFLQETEAPASMQTPPSAENTIVSPVAGAAAALEKLPEPRWHFPEVYSLPQQSRQRPPEENKGPQGIAGCDPGRVSGEEAVLKTSEAAANEPRWKF